MQIESLMQLGFTEKEAMVYLILLRIGPSPASVVANRLDIKRATAYAVLNSLCQRGIVSFEEMNNGRRFIPHDPECILYNLERQESDLKFRMQVAKNCVEKLQNNSVGQDINRQKIVYHKGAKAIHKFLKEKISNDFPLRVLFMDFGTNSQSSKILNDYLEKLSQKCVENIFLCIPEGMKKIAKNLYENFLIFESDMENIFVNGQLLLCENKVIFIFSNDKETELMCLEDPFYSTFVESVLMKDYFE